MTTKVAPWLEGLSEAWEMPSKPPATKNVSSATHNASSLRNSSSRISRRSLSGLPSSLSHHNSTSQASTQRRRNPLAPLSSNDANTLRRNNGMTKVAGTRSVSAASDGSLLACGTVQQRSKSASPIKKQETLEWKRRLVNGQVGYGDQTDLFGATGLENIFAKSKGEDNEAPKPNNRMSWLQKSDAPMPSSPPPWPSSFAGQQQPIEEQDEESLDPRVEEQTPPAYGVSDDLDANGSFRSNPFDLESFDEPQRRHGYAAKATSPHPSSPEKAFIEITEDESVANRTVSGQTEMEQEDFSPVFISKHTTVNGQVDYAALDSHLVKQFQNITVNLRHPSQKQSQDTRSNSDAQQREGVDLSTFTDGPETQSLPVAQDLSFSENLPTGSPFPNLGRHVELKRGGYSQYGSFKQRPLSPSQSTMQNYQNPDASGLISVLSSDAQLRPPAPTPPRAPSTPTQAEEPTSRSSGSPLKLFGPHDTFTNNRLLRRMSQLNPDGTLRQPPAESRNEYYQSSRKVSQTSSFGNGELEDHAFNAEITITSASDSDKNDSDRSPGSEIAVPGSKTPLGFIFEASPEVKDTFKLKRKLSKNSAANSKGSTLESQPRPEPGLQATVEDVSESHDDTAAGPAQARSYAEGKRPPTSPFKNPTPKRRRTLHASEFENDMAGINNSYHSQLQEAVSSRKRRDARPGESQNTADPETLAQRRILRPRNPTPSQRRRQQIEAELREAAEEFAEQEPEKLAAVMEQVESSMASDASPTLQQHAQTLASEVAAFTLKVHKPSNEYGERKRSVTTQDFLDEAMMVMNLIRAKARPQSILGSFEESDAEAFVQSLRADGSQPGDPLLRVSRPPSREGSGWRRHAPVQTDARAVSHLRKFQEREERDNTDFIANSVVSLPVDEPEQINDQMVIVSETSNIRITGPPSDHDRQREDSDSLPVSQRSQGSTFGTQDSGGTSTGQTVGTNSTRKSDNVGTLAPDAVAHLIGDQVGGMTFDKDKQRWVRVSKSPDKGHGSFLELPSNVTSDDDPFREISDLPVDEQNELRRISSPAKVTQEAATIDDSNSLHHQSTEQQSQQPAVESRTSSQETVIGRPVTRDSSHIRHNHSSSVPSRYTACASSRQVNVETRATSWSDEELARLSALGKARQQPPAYAAPQAAIAQRGVHETDLAVLVQEGTEMTFPSPPTHRLPTNIATVDHGKLAPAEQDVELSDLRDDTTIGLADSDIEDITSPKLRQTPSRPAVPPYSTHVAATRQMSLRRKTLTNRFTAEAHEQSELSFVAPLPGDRMISLALSVSRPLSTRHQARQITELQSSPSKVNSSFILSDLPDFTVHEVDEERPSERALATRLAQRAAAEVNDRYALAVKELVKILTDVNEDEPYWDDLKQLDLRDRCLASLHGLDDFCTRVQDMDVSYNALTHVHGTPATVRSMNARSNQLSGLTAWNHLVNLQYLDISHNYLDSLDSLGSLVHLRELRADDNNITRIDGLFELDGLLKLRARRNKLQHVDFKGSQLDRLTDLDLNGNQITSVDRLDHLLSLADLKLDENSLTHGLPIENPMLRLTSLSMQDCNVEFLDVSCFPGLKRLNVDDNQLNGIKGIDRLGCLDELCMRRQVLPQGVAISIFDSTMEARTVQLSGNTMPVLHLSNSFLNLQHLELASAGLQELPDEVGLRLPNLRTLNLNFNSLKDIRPLLNIQKLERLSVCGNRLHRLRKSIATLAKMTSLQTLDFRDNPLTQGFYASLASTMSRHTSIVRKVRDPAAEDEDEQAAQLDKSRYELPGGDCEHDRQHRSRLDEDTELRRRVYELLLANSCRALHELDGLHFDKGKAIVKDFVWDRLVELGIIRKSQYNDVELVE